MSTIPTVPAPDAPMPSKATTINYSAEEVISTFIDIYYGLDFTKEIKEMGFDTFQIKLRKKATQDLYALSIALWELALKKCFPADADTFFAHLLATAPMFSDKNKTAETLQDRLALYRDLLKEKKDADFAPVATFLIEELSLTAKDMIHFKMRLSLSMRSLYSHIFNHLV